ncbi:MAG TPA: beta-glucosidase [Steroidobacteraceae bacterium]
MNRELRNGPEAWSGSRCLLIICALAWCASAATAATDVAARPWLDARQSPDERAELALAAMTLPEKLSLLHGPMPAEPPGQEPTSIPEGAIPTAGYIPGVRRLGIPAMFETDASLGVVNPLGQRDGDVATAMPAGLALASAFDPPLAYRLGTDLGIEAHAKGFNVLLGGGMDLTRDPRNGRNFEYLGEDPLLAGTLAGEAVRGTQDQHVISTLKHFALNAHETNRSMLDAQIDRAALRESDLLAFEIAIERGRPGAIMCAYNRINGDYSCGNSWLLNEVLKRDWQYRGWVLSDWGAVYAPGYEMKGLDQESGQQNDKHVWFGAALKAAVEAGSVPMSRIDDMVRRILRTMFAVGIVDYPPIHEAIDYKGHDADALEAAREGIVLLKNDGPLLPLSPLLKRIALIGGQAHVGVLSGGGSSQVTPSNGPAVTVPVGGRDLSTRYLDEHYFPSSPGKAIQAAAPNAEVLYNAGKFPEDAAALAATADVAIVFVTRHELEGIDIPNLRLPNGQDGLVDAVAKANAHTIVVLETGNPVAMPWLNKVSAVLAAWYPGQEGGRAIADILFGTVNPSGHLPITFPADERQSMRPVLPNLGAEPDSDVTVNYTEGADVGYRWYRKHDIKPLYAFGYGLSYSVFDYGDFEAKAGNALSVSFSIKNVSTRSGADVPQVYLLSAAGQRECRLLGFQRVQLAAGERQLVKLTLDRRLFARFDEGADRWHIAPGIYRIVLARSAEDIVATQEIQLSESSFK